MRADALSFSFVYTRYQGPGSHSNYYVRKANEAHVVRRMPTTDCRMIDDQCTSTVYTCLWHMVCGLWYITQTRRCYRLDHTCCCFAASRCARTHSSTTAILAIDQVLLLLVRAHSVWSLPASRCGAVVLVLVLKSCRSTRKSFTMLSRTGMLREILFETCDIAVRRSRRQQQCHF